MSILFAPVTGKDLIDREEIIDDILRNFQYILKGFGSAYVLIGRRRVGKSSVLQEVYNRMRDIIVTAPEEKKIIPVYINFEHMELICNQFANLYFRIVVSNYYYSMTGKDIPARRLTFSDISAIAKELNDSALEELVDAMQKTEDYDRLSFAFNAPRMLGEGAGRYFAVMLDEFQNILEIENDAGRRWGKQLLGNFREGLETKAAFHLISGSAVRIITKEIIGSGPLLGRFTPLYIHELEEHYAIELCNKLAERFELELDEEQSIYLCNYANNNPFYITAILTIVKNTLDRNHERTVTSETISNAIAYELTTGTIFNTFEDQFQRYFHTFNEIGLTRAIMGSCARFDDEAIPVDDVLEEVRKFFGPELTRERVIELLARLARADLLEDRGGIFRDDLYYNIPDPILRKYLRFQYEIMFRNTKSTIVSEEEYTIIFQKLSQAHIKIGLLFEYKIRELMKRFDGRTVECERFHREGAVVLPKFISVYPTKVQCESSPGFQLDAVGLFTYPNGERKYWVVESKYRENRIGKNDLKKFIDACTCAEKQLVHEVTHRWFFSKSGFTDDAVEYARDNTILLSDINDLNGLFTLFGMPKLEY